MLQLQNVGTKKHILPVQSLIEMPPIKPQLHTKIISTIQLWFFLKIIKTIIILISQHFKYVYILKP